MHAAFAAWITAQPWRAVVIAACLSSFPGLYPFGVVVAAAIPVLLVLRNDVRMAVVAALAAAIAPVLLIGVQTQAAQVALFGSLLLLGVPLGYGWLLGRSGSLNLCFQLAVLLLGVLVVVAHQMVADPASALWSGFVREWMRQVPQEGDPAQLQAAFTRTLWGVFVALSLVSVLSSLFLGRWWSSLLDAELKGSFGVEYRALRLGKMLGVLVTAVVLVSWWSDSALLASLAWVSGGALFLQGLSAAHRRKARGMLNQGWLTAMYVSLVVPLLVLFPAILLTAWGFADTWRQLFTPNV